MTPYINYGGENVITVKVDNSSQPGSRWYTGTGIYRHTHLIITDNIYIPVWGNYIISDNVENDVATLDIETTINNDFKNDEIVDVVYTLLNNKGIEIKRITAHKDIRINGQNSRLLRAQLKVDNPNLWSTDSPYLYNLKTDVVKDGCIVYSQNDKIGIRTLGFDSDKGFLLNGKNVKLKGVCLHHDGGLIGSAVARKTIERQLHTLREMGANAVRTAHHPFSETFMNVCDSMGFLVLNEMFDEWEVVKKPSTTQNGKRIRISVDYYAKIFKEWADKDLTDFVLRDRNHPSVIMWSIGNEIEQMRKEEGAVIGKRLADIVHNLDYRPVTNGVNGYGWGKWPNEDAILTGDVLGYNYIKDDGFDKERKLHPDKPVVVTEHETAQNFYPRDTYLYGEQKDKWWNKLGYEFDEAYKWAEKRDLPGTSGIDAWKWVKSRTHVMGMFMWTGWDYLGETIPFGWPAKSSSFGVVDLCGFPKDGYYFYQSQWTDKPMVHIFPHWNLSGMEGKKVTVYGFTNADEVELFQDGKSLGKQKNDVDAVEYQQWNTVYSPGELKAVAYKDGKVVAEDIVRTAGSAYAIKIETDDSLIKADGQDLAYLECKIIDNKGNIVPIANNILEFEIEGPAEITGIDNGNNMCVESFKSMKHSAFGGRCLAVVRTGMRSGDVVVRVKSQGLEGDSIVLRCR